MKEFWNERYAAKEFAYGTTPNTFFKKVIDGLPAGRMLLPAEGEGRNAVYAATIGWQVFAFDLSEAGKEKAGLLAADQNVSINYSIATFSDYNFAPGSFDCLALIFCHLPSAMRRQEYRRLFNALRPGGLLVLQGFSKAQLGKKSGGPKDADFLFSIEELTEDFKDAKDLEIFEEEQLLDEGPFHQGPASLISLTAHR